MNKGNPSSIPIPAVQPPSTTRISMPIPYPPIFSIPDAQPPSTPSISMPTVYPHIPNVQPPSTPSTSTPAVYPHFPNVQPPSTPTSTPAVHVYPHFPNVQPPSTPTSTPAVYPPMVPIVQSPSTSTDTESLPLTHQYFNDPLPSSEIATDKLISVEEALENVMKGGRKAPLPSTVTQSLAKSAIFGTDIMKRCTPSGSNSLSALLKAEMQNLKRHVFRVFPRYWHSPAAFEVEWKTKCWPAMEQACRRLRRTN